MRSAFSYSLVICVASVFSQQPFVRYSENLRKAVPHHYNHDQKNTDRGVDKVARGHKIEPHQPPLRPQPAVPWLRWVHEGRWAAQADKNTELHRVRARLLEEKLKPNQFAFKPRINPQLKPKLSQKEKARIKREAEKTKVVKIQKETGVKENVRHKREAPMSQLVPDIIMQPHMDAKIPQPMDQFAGRVEEPKKRKKRQILYFINKPPQLLARSPRTTPNPFIRDTHIDEYDIIRPEVGEREGMIPTVEEGSSDPGSYPLVKIPQALFRFLQIAKIKIEQSFLAKTEPTDNPNRITEDSHVRVKRRMSRFVRDRKQMTRKKKIGRAKKTKVRRAPVKMKKWFDKRQKVKKKGDGTYRGGRGRKPRQHKRPRHYKPTMNETSDYDYYDSKGNIRGEDNQEGPDVAEYLSYESGEYADTEEAERANQELEKEYQDQLKRERVRGKQRKLSNNTEQSPEEINYVPYSKSSETKRSTKIKGGEGEKGVKGRKVSEMKRKDEKKEGKKERIEESEDREESEESEGSVSKSKAGYGQRRIKPKERTEESTEETESEESEESEEESTEEDSSGGKRRVEVSSEEGSSEDSSGDSSGEGKRRKFPRKYKKSPKWKQGKIGKYESDPKKIQNKQGLVDKVDVKASMQVTGQKHYSSIEKADRNDAVVLKEKKNTVDQQKGSTAIKNQASANVRKAARKFNFFSLSSYPVIRNFMTARESESANAHRNFMHPKDHALNRMSSLRFESPHHIAIQRLQSMPLKPPPGAVSLTNPNVVSRGGENLQNLQSKKAGNSLQSTFKDRMLTSIAQEKPRDTLTLVSEIKDERKKWTSTGTDQMRSIQSLKVDPVVLTSIAKTIPEVKIDQKETEKNVMEGYAKTDGGTVRNSFSDHNGKKTRVRGPDELTSIARNIPPLNIDNEKKSRKIKKNDLTVHEGERNDFVDSEKVNAQANQHKVAEKIHKEDLKMKRSQMVNDVNNKISKREVNQEEHKEMSYEELSSIPDSAGASIPSDEIESASGDKK